MKETAKILTIFVSLIFLFSVFSCAKKQVVKEEEPIPPPEIEEKIEIPVEPEVVELSLANVYFDFDRSDIRPTDARILEGNAAQLKDNPMVNVLIEGHCCPLGTDEYNMALGWRRANSAQDYLIKLGISKSRISTMSYGEERLVTSMEPEFWKNRRCEFKKQ